MILRRHNADIFELKRSIDNGKDINCKRTPILSKTLVKFSPQIAKINCMHGKWRTGRPLDSNTVRCYIHCES